MHPIEPKEFTIGEKTYTLSKFPAIAGREIIAGYPLTSIPKVGEYKLNEEIMLKLMCYVFIKINDQLIPLNNRALVDNHIRDWEILAQVEWEMMQYNCSFFRNGRLSTFFEDVAQKLPAWTTKILMGLSDQLSQKSKQPSTSSEQSTA
jgi:hypothetical protein